MIVGEKVLFLETSIESHYVSPHPVTFVEVIRRSTGYLAYRIKDVDSKQFIVDPEQVLTIDQLDAWITILKKSGGE